jgi:ankyrin repeat protein
MPRVGSPVSSKSSSGSAARSCPRLGVVSVLGWLATGAVSAASGGEVAQLRVTERTARARVAVGESTRLLQRSAQVWTMTQSCTSCHHQMLGTMTVRLVEEKGLPADRSMREVQVASLRRRLEAKRHQHYFGLSSANPAIAESYALWALDAAGHPAGPETDAAVHALALRQGNDGRWPSLGHQPPLEDSAVTATALTLRALVVFPPAGRRAELAGRVARAREWLRAVEPRDSEEQVMQVFGLAWAGAGESELRPLLEALRRRQNRDGGWSQLPTRASDAYATGQALVALHALGAEAVSGDVYRRGVDFLLESFDGASWHVRSRAEPRYAQHPETGYPHSVDQFSSYAGTCWATMALALVVEPGPTRILAADPAPRAEGVAPDLSQVLAATLFGTTDDLRALLDSAGAEALSARGPLGLTPLIAAAPDPEKTALLLARGADPDAASEIGLLPLHVAAWSEAGAESVRLLLGAGARPQTPTPFGLVPAYLSAISGRVEALEILNAASRRPWRWPDREAPHPLLVAVERGDAAMIETLLRAGIDPDAPRSEQGLTPLQIAVRNRSQGLAALLLRWGADPAAADTEGRTALHWAATSDAGHAGIVEMLLAAGADVGARSRRGGSPLEYARESGNTHVVALLAGPER